MTFWRNFRTIFSLSVLDEMNNSINFCILQLLFLRVNWLNDYSEENISFVVKRLKEIRRKRMREGGK